MNIDYQEPAVAVRPFNAQDIKSAQEWLGKPDTVYPGYVSASGTAISLPTGWTSVKTGTGAYTITHNLSTTNYVLTITAAGAQLGIPSIYTINATTFTLSMFTTGAVAADCAFTFILMPTS